MIFPSIPARLAEGFSERNVSGQEISNLDNISAGRLTGLWPPTLDEIAKSPLIGHGRMSIYRRHSLFNAIVDTEGACPSHPHNAYLEMMLDCGVMGLFVILVLFAGVPYLVLTRSCTHDPLLRAVSGTGLAAAGTILIMSLSGQSFFPREGVFLILCAYGLMLRGYIMERQNSIQTITSSRVIAGSDQVVPRIVAGISQPSLANVKRFGTR